ncbi:MAG: PEGA domain-containing protein [Deltaproteobacteria bacterium]|nr:PEGA domain-containing protein [Deltaproteobacteria bacterium]
MKLFSVFCCVCFINQQLAFAKENARKVNTLQRYAIIIGNNLSLDANTSPLTFADDDAARFFELFSAAEAKIQLFTVLDANAQKRYAKAAKQAQPPLRRKILSAIDNMFKQIRDNNASGITTHFYFIFSGHGNVGANHEGYINLQDARFHRSELYREVLARSPATYNHLILDACHAYFLVNKRGDGDSERYGDYQVAVRDFLRTEELASYPNTGVLLASSSESKTHEWSLWESGVFSHELRSALVGGADVNSDGKVTYAEAAAFIEAANVAIPDPKARLRVFYQAPQVNIDAPIFDTKNLQQKASIVIEPSVANHYFVEDKRGVRILDVHPTNEQTVRVALIGNAPFFIKTETKESRPINKGIHSLARLKFRPLSLSHRGSTETSFRRYLFSQPFGENFYKGLIAGIQKNDSSITNNTFSIKNTGPTQRLLVADLQGAQKYKSLIQASSEAIRETASKVGGFNIIDTKTLPSKDKLSDTFEDCLKTANCIQATAHKAQADLLVIGELNEIGSNSWQLIIRSLDGNSGVELEKRSETIKGDENKVVQLAQLLTQSLIGVGSPTGKLDVAASPAGALIRIDGQIFATAPMANAKVLSAGKHLLTVEAENFSAQVEEIVIIGGKTESLKVDLKPTEIDKPISNLKRTSYGMLIAGGTAGVTAGAAYFLALNAHQSYEQAKTKDDAQLWHDRVEKRMLITNIAAVSAAALAITGGVLWLIDSKNSPDTPPALTINVFGAPNHFSFTINGHW